MGISETQMLNQIWFEIHGGDKVKAINKDIADALKEIKKESDLAEQSINKVVKKWSTLAQTPPNMKNISSAVYSKQEKRYTEQWARNTHASQKYLASDYYNEGKVDYSAARTAWKAIEAEKKRTLMYQQEINKYLAEQAKQAALAAYTDKKITQQKKKEEKSRPMTDFQKQKIRLGDLRNERAVERNTNASRKEDRLAREYADNEGLRRFKNKHPELFAEGGLNHNKRYQTGQALSGIGSAIGSIGNGGKVIGNILDSIGAFARGVPAGIATTITHLTESIVDLGTASIKAYSEIEAIKTQLGVVFSNQTQADSMFSDISRYAVKSPFGVQQTSEMAVLLKQSGVYATDLMDTLRMIGDTAGGNIEKMTRIANNYAQIVSIGKASMLDMRQFAYAGIPIFEAVSKELGVSQQELRKLISDGKVTSDIIEKVFKDLTGINGIFENATAKGARTLKARLQNLADARQLAYGEIGKSIVGLGTQTGNDSFVNGIVTTTENIYQWLHDNVSTRNIEEDVKTIARRNDRIAELSNALSSFSDNKIMSSIVALAYDAEKSLKDIDYERNIYNQSYESKMRGHNEAVERFGITNLNEAEEFLEVINYLTSGFTRINYNFTNEALTNYKNWSGAFSEKPRQMMELADKFGLDIDFLSNTTKEETKAIRESATALVQALSDYSKVTEEETKAHRETGLIEAQQLAFDQASKAASSNTSYAKGFDELYSLYTSSEEYKQEQQAKQIEFLKESQKVLKELVSYADKEGNLDISKLSYDKLTQYLDPNKRVLDEGTKLQIVEGNKQISDENRKLLTEQWTKVSDDVLEELKNNGMYSAAEQLQAARDSYSLNGDNKSFFNNFNLILEQQLGILKELANAESDNSKKEEYQTMTRAIMASTFKYGVNDKGLLANLEDLLKGKEKPDFTPLWKRIIASATGWSAERIFSQNDFMKEYQKYSAQQIARGGIQGLAMAGGKAGEIGTMLSYTGTINKQGVHQIDWQKTQDNIYKYALNLETPLKKASATMKGLADAMQDQVKVYRKLTADIYTVGEDWTTINNDIKGQYNVAQGLGNANILDNAFEAMAANSDKFKFSFDEEKGLVVFDKISNQIVGSIEELKNSNEISDSSLKDFLKDIHVDNLVSALDKASEEIERQVVVTQINSEMLSEANKLVQERASENAKTLGESAIILGALKNRNVTGANSLIARNDNSVGYMAGSKVNQSFASVLQKIVELDISKAKSDEFAKELLSENNSTLALQALQNILKEGTSISNLEKAMEFFIMNFPEATNRIVKESTKTAENIKANELITLADNTLRNSPLSILDALTTDRMRAGNNPIENTIMTSLGSPYTSFSSFSKKMTESAITNPSENTLLTNRYKENIFKELDKTDISKERIQELKEEIESFASTGAWKDIESELNKIGDGKIWETATNGANKWALSLGNIGTTLENISQDLSKLAENFISDSITTTFSTWGSSLAKGESASENITKNLGQMAAGFASNMGQMLTQAGLALAISSIGDKAGVMTGLAIAAAGTGLSFIGGYLNGAMDDDKNKEDQEWQKLLKVKEDLSELIKQAREDAIYYEKTLRHKNAIGANEQFKTKSVNDAIITPSGQVVTTDPKDYLIATKTPQQFVSGGAPTINFSVIDKSTGIKVTQQRSTYDEKTNSIEFEAIIESKVQEIIATSKGDDAFNAREARINGRTVIA